MPTVEEVARRVIADINSSAGVLLASRWVAERYTRLCARTRFRQLRKVGELHVPAVLDTGLATITRGAVTVTGDATAQAAWTPDLVGRFFRGNVAWYKIVDVLGGQLKLATPYAEDAITAAAYHVAPRHLKLDKEVRWLGERFFHARRRNFIYNRPLSVLDSRFPDRPYVSGGPQVWSEIGTSDENERIIELYPYSSETELVNFVYWAIPPTLKHTDMIPPQVDEHVLKEGALIDAMRYEAARGENIEKAAFWRNEYRSQATSWERQVLEAIRADKGVDDATFLVNTLGVEGPTQHEIRDARDFVYQNWP